jgi:hypothetical protein
MASAYVRVKEAFVGAVGKEAYDFRTGELVPAGHPAVAKWPDLFEPVVSRFEVPMIEQATAGPSEKRHR